MLLRYFRINDPYRLLGLLVILLIMYLPLFIDPPSITSAELKSMVVGEKIHEGSQMYVEVTDNTAPLAAWFHALFDIVFGRSLLARHIIAFIIIFFQSAFLGVIFITKKVFNENTFIPSLLFSVLFFFSFDTLSLTDELLGSGFLLLALNNLFKEIEFRMQRDETTFNLGIYISLASLFYFPYMTFLFGVLVSLFLFARADARKFLLFVFGFLLPHLFVISISYLNGSLAKIWEFYYLSNLSFGAEFLVSTKGLLVLSLIPIFYLIISMVMLNRLARFSKYQSQMLQSIFLWIGFCFIYFLFCRELRPQTLIVLIPPVTFLFTHFLLLIRRRKFAEMNTWILLLGTILFSYLARYDNLGGVNYANLFVGPIRDKEIQNKRILVLGDEEQYYLTNKAATPFINWELSQNVFEHPEYYESITDVYTGFKQDPPEVIIDKNNLLKPFLERMPDLRQQYARRGDTYVKTKISN
jgi:hypothetical protein